jgi:hypothetical protein
VDPRRYNLKWASAAEAPRFVKLITEFTQTVKELGPLGQAEGIDPEELKTRINKALAAVESKKVRMTFGTATKSLRKDNILDPEQIVEVVQTKMEKSLATALK